MINKIKNKVKQVGELIEANQQMQQDTLALTQLLKLFDNGVFLPLTSWSISPREVLHICNDIVLNKRQNIVEFGAGFSTLCIAQLLKVTSCDAKFTTVENNSAWALDMEKNLKRLGLQDYVNIIHAPITPLPTEFAFKDQATWYDVTKLSTLQNAGIDLIIVDGPYGGSTPFARYSAVPFLRKYMADDFAVFLDDSNRNDEKVIAAQWQKILNSNSKNHKRYTYLTNVSNFDVAPFGNK